MIAQITTTAYEHSITVPAVNNTKFEVCILADEVIVAINNSDGEMLQEVILTVEQAKLLRNHLVSLQKG
jgi:hypothetical protein